MMKGIKHSVVLACALALMGCQGLRFWQDPDEETFTIAVIPDVQPEVAKTLFKDRLEWLVANQAALNLKMVLQCGDLMNFNDDVQYAHQSKGLEVLDNAHIPYAMTLGNHDTAAVRVDSGSAATGNVNANLRNTAKYNAYFPTNRFTMLAGTYQAGKIDNAYHTFTAGGLNWVVINLELWARTGAVEWAKSVVTNHPNHNVIFLTHAHLKADSTIQQDKGGYGDNSPQYIFDQAMRPYPNVRLVFCGHTGTHGYRTDTGDSGNTIHQFLQCYHDNTTNPTRLIEIDSKKGTLTTRVYGASIGQDKQDGSSRTITGIQWVQP